MVRDMVLFVVTRINEWMLLGRDYEQLRGKKDQEQRRRRILIRRVLLNCAIDGASLYPTYRKPFDMIFPACEKMKHSRGEWI